MFSNVEEEKKKTFILLSWGHIWYKKGEIDFSLRSKRQGFIQEWYKEEGNRVRSARFPSP